MKKILFISLAIVLALSVGIIGCTAAPTQQEEEEEEPEPIELNLSHFMSEMHPMHKGVMAPFAEDVAEATEGRVTITIYSGGALVSGPPNQYDGAVTGVTDIAFGLHGYTAGKFPLTSVMELPNLVTSAAAGSAVLWELYETFPEIVTEHDGVKVLALWTHDTGQVMTTQQPIHTLADFTGLTIRAPTSSHVSLVEAWGATAVYMPISEVYDSLDKDVIQGTVVPYSAVKSFKLDEVVNYITVVDAYVATMFLVINLDSWNQISAGDQAIIEGLIGSTMSETAGAAYDSARGVGLSTAQAANITIYELPPAELANWEAAVAPLHQQWIDDVEALGLPGQEIYDEAVRLAAMY